MRLLFEMGDFLCMLNPPEMAVAIAGEDPAAATEDPKSARDLWLQWGRERRLIG